MRGRAALDEREPLKSSGSPLIRHDFVVTPSPTRGEGYAARVFAPRLLAMAVKGLCLKSLRAKRLYNRLAGAPLDAPLLPGDPQRRNQSQLVVVVDG
jgi:hypothetical protein